MQGIHISRVQVAEMMMKKRLKYQKLARQKEQRDSLRDPEHRLARFKRVAAATASSSAAATASTSTPRQRQHDTLAPALIGTDGGGGGGGNLNGSGGSGGGHGVEASAFNVWSPRGAAGPDAVGGARTPMSASSVDSWYAPLVKMV